ncbi:MAG TPA: hypothetical protein VFC27_02225 [Anaerovoracaceae bacterium]|nr:hypothetical protein [Anaerovoracaceae bacterium]
MRLKKSWEVLKNWADNFVSCPDYVTAKGMRMLASAIDGEYPGR